MNIIFLNKMISVLSTTWSVPTPLTSRSGWHLGAMLGFPPQQFLDYYYFF